VELHATAGISVNFFHFENVWVVPVQTLIVPRRLRIAFGFASNRFYSSSTPRLCSNQVTRRSSDGVH
jgi:hypothetical protein